MTTATLYAPLSFYTSDSMNSLHGVLQCNSRRAFSTTAPPSPSVAKAPEMEYRNLGSSGLKVSAVSIGSWVTFGNQVCEKSFNNDNERLIISVI